MKELTELQKKILIGGLLSGSRSTFKFACHLAKTPELLPCPVCDYPVGGCKCALVKPDEEQPRLN